MKWSKYVHGKKEYPQVRKREAVELKSRVPLAIDGTCYEAEGGTSMRERLRARLSSCWVKEWPRVPLLLVVAVWGRELVVGSEPRSERDATDFKRVPSRVCCGDRPTLPTSPASFKSSMTCLRGAVMLFLRLGYLLPMGEYWLCSLRLRQAFWKLKASSFSLCSFATGRRYLGGGIFSPGWYQTLLSLFEPCLDSEDDEEDDLDDELRPRARLTRSRKAMGAGQGARGG